MAKDKIQKKSRKFGSFLCPQKRVAHEKIPCKCSQEDEPLQPVHEGKPFCSGGRINWYLNALLF